MPGVVEQNIFIRLDDSDSVVIEMFLQPIGLHQRFWMRVLSWMCRHRIKNVRLLSQASKGFCTEDVIARALGSARLSRVGERVLAVANFFSRLKTRNGVKFRKSSFRRDAETSTRHACARQNRRQRKIESAG